MRARGALSEPGTALMVAASIAKADGLVRLVPPAMRDICSHCSERQQRAIARGEEIREGVQSLIESTWNMIPDEDRARLSRLAVLRDAPGSESGRARFYNRYLAMVHTFLLGYQRALRKIGVA